MAESLVILDRDYYNYLFSIYIDNTICVSFLCSVTYQIFPQLKLILISQCGTARKNVTIRLLSM